MNIRIIFILSALLLAPMAAAERLPIESLGALELRYAAAEAVDRYAGAPLAAKVDFRPGEGVSLVTPHRVQRITHLVAPGTRVAAGQHIAVLSGPEIHHFITAFEVTRERYATAERRYQRNRELYQQQAIDESRWIEIAEAYYALQLEYEHMRHFREILQPAADDPNSITLLAPTTGILSYSQRSPGIDAGQELAVVIPDHALRLRVSVPLNRQAELAALKAGECRAAVDSVSGIATDFFLEAWSEPLGDDCALFPGQRLMVTPLFQRSGFRVPSSALFERDGQASLLVRRGSEMESVAVDILEGIADNYIVSCDRPLEGAAVLVSSVSAVQGVIMGLGGE